MIERRMAEIETLREENEALRVALDSLLRLCRKRNVIGLEVRLAENALNRRIT